MKKKVVSMALSTVLSLAMAIPAFAGNWETVGNDWKYKEDNGTYAANGWQWIDGKSYYFDASGIMAKDTTIDGYTVNSDGQWTVNGVVQTQGTTGQTANTNGVNHSDGYDPAHPLKNVMDAWNLRLTPDDAHWNYYYVCSDENVQTMLTGQLEYYNERIDNGRYDVEKVKSDENELYQWFCNWLNGMDFEHMSEMERAQEIKKVLGAGHYEAVSENRNRICSVLIDKKGECADYSMTAMSLAKVMGLKAAIFGTGNHVAYYIQADGTVYEGSNAVLSLEHPSYFTPYIWTN